MQVALLCCYPVLIHLSVVLQQPLLRVPALVLLTAGIAYKGLLRKSRAAWITLITVVLVTLAASQINEWLYAFYLPPVLIPALIASVFIRSLLPGREPLVTAIGERARGPLTVEMRSYTRIVTLMWAILLCSMTLLGIVLPLTAGEHIWSLYTNVISYLLVAVFFVGEYLYRRFHFKDHDHPGFRQYLEIVLRSGNNNRRK